MDTMPLLLPLTRHDLVLDSVQEETIECYEQEGVDIGGFLVAYETHRSLVLNARLTEEEKAEGRMHLLSRLNENPHCRRGLFIWRRTEAVSDSGSEAA